MSALDLALFKVESIHHIHGNQCLCGFKSAISRDRTKHIMEATLEAVKGPILALHPKTCEINGADSLCDPEECVVQVCGPCGEPWPCPTVKALTE